MSEHRNFLAARNSMHGEDEGTAEEGRNNVNDQASRELVRSRYNTNGGGPLVVSTHFTPSNRFVPLRDTRINKPG